MPDETINLRLTGMHCAACVRAVEQGLEALEGVSSASVNLAEESAEVVHDPRLIGPEQIIERVDRLGYGASLIEEPTAALAQADQERGREQRQLTLFIFGAVLSAP